MSSQNLPPSGTSLQIPGTTLVQDTHYSVNYVQAVNALQTTADDFSAPGSRYWLSIPRRMDNPTWDVLLINFRQPVSVSQISFELFEFAQNWEFWYYSDKVPELSSDTNPYVDPTARLPILDRSLRPLVGTLDTGAIDKWYSYEYQINPVIIRTLEMRIQRKNDNTIDPTKMISVGVRNLLCKREIYGAQDTMLPLEPGIDPMGNLVESYIRRWDARQAIDGNSTTYWKSEPQPSPDAIVNFYLDVRDQNGNAQRIDRIYLDPVHTGQSLNMYYSSDDTVGPRTLSITDALPIVEQNVNWVKNVGLDMSSSTAIYSLNTQPFNIDTSKSIWIAGTWIPGFNSWNPPAVNMSLVTDNASNFHIIYKPLLNQFEVLWGTYTVSYVSLPFYSDYKLHFSVRIIQPGNSAGLAAGIYFEAMDDTGFIISTSTMYPHTTLYPSTNIYPEGATANITPSNAFLFPSTLSIKYCQGFISDLFIKQDAVGDNEVTAALLDVRSYLLPQIPAVSSNYTFQETSLTNMVYAADFAVSETGFGGLDNLYFAEKLWSPVWMDWVVNKGIYYLPDVIYAKYINFEFTNLTPQPYTIHESGIEVEYQTFPIEVLEVNQNISNVTTTFADTRNTQTSSTRGILYDNYYSTTSTSTSQTNSAPVYFVNVGTATIGTLPRLFDQPLSTSIVEETYTDITAATYATTNSQVIAADAYYTVVSGDWLIKIGKRYNIPWQTIYNLNRSLVDNDPRVKLLPHRSPGWWIFPGQRLRIPNAIMDQITNTSVTTEKTVSTSKITTTRNRFVKTQVHRYETRTATRDAAIAYFAGIKEVNVYTVNYTLAEDTEIYNFPLYDTQSFTMTNMFQYPFSGGWESTAHITPVTLLYPDPTQFPSPTLYPVGSGSYAPSLAEWGDHNHTWGAVNAAWGYVPIPITGVIESNTWKSLSMVQSIEIDVYDRGLHQPISGRQLAPLGLNNSPVGYWSSLGEDWADSVVVWGTRTALVAEDFRSNIQFAGQPAYRIHRVAGVGVAGLTTSDFYLLAHSRIRVSVDYYRPVATTNDIILQIVDVSNSLQQSVIFQQTIKEYYIGKWSTYHTNFYIVSDFDIPVAEIRLLISGTQDELLYVGSLYPSVTTIVYEFSNDGGQHYYEANEVAYSNSTVRGLVFPTPNNSLRSRVTLFDPNNDYVFGQTIVPEYI